MWWKNKNEPESTYHGMALGFLMNRHDVRIDAHCKTCDGYQHLYLKELIETHGKTAILRDVEPEIACYFCKKAGAVSVRFLKR